MSITRRRIIPAAVLLIVLALDILVTVSVSENLLDNDASGEMVLSKCLYDEKSLICPDWEYATEIRVANQLVFAPLFRFFSDWTAVRITGTLIIQAILTVSLVFLLKSAGLKPESVILGCILILLPYCVAYGRITLYHCYYALYISLSFVILGLFIRTLSGKNRKISFVFLILLSAAGCLNGIRIAFIAILPLCFLAFWFLIRERKTDMFRTAFFCGLAGILGLLLFSFVIAKSIHINTEFRYRLSFRGISEAWIILLSILRQFGYRSMIDRKSFLGVMSLAGIGTAVYSLFLSAKAFFAEKDEKRFLLSSMLFTGILLTGATFLFAELPFSSRSDYARYLVPASVWIVPLFCLKSEQSGTGFSKSFLYLILAVFAGNGMINMSFFYDPRHFSQEYDGLPFHSTESVKRFESSARFIRENGYELGYAFYDINSLTEYMDGFPVIGISYDGENLSWWDWLTRLSLRNIPAENCFLIADKNDADTFRALTDPEDSELVYREQDMLFIYRLNDPEGFKRFLDKNR